MALFVAFQATDLIFIINAIINSETFWHLIKVCRIPLFSHFEVEGENHFVRKPLLPSSANIWNYNQIFKSDHLFREEKEGKLNRMNYTYV